MESMTSPDDRATNYLLERMATTLQQQPSGINPLVPSFNPSGQQDLSTLHETFVHSLWQGLIAYKSEEVKLPLTCTMSCRVTSKEKLCADKWSKLLKLYLFAQYPFWTKIRRRIMADPHSVMIQFGKESEASLCNILWPGLVGIVVFPATCVEAFRFMDIICLPDNRTFLGSFFEDETREKNIEEEILPLLKTLHLSHNKFPVVNNSNIQMNASMPVSQQQLQQQSPQQAQDAHYLARMAQCTHANNWTAHEASGTIRLRRSHKPQTLPYPQFKPNNPVLSFENISSISGASCTRGTDTENLINQQQEQRQPQQQEGLQTRVAAHQTSTNPNNPTAIRRNKLRIELKAMCQQGVHNKPLSLLFPKFKSNHPVSSLEDISGICGSSHLRGINITSCPVTKNSAGSQAGEIFKKDLVQKVKLKVLRQTGKVPQAFKLLCDDILGNVKIEPESSGASTNDKTVEELMSKLERCSVLHSSNE